MKSKRKISIITLGCKVNQYESNSIARKLIDDGFDVVQSLDKADGYIINTCAVTNEAERKSRGIIAKVKKLNDKAPIFVCGCSAQNSSEKFLKFENVVAVYGTSSKFELTSLINEYFKNPSFKKTTHLEISKEYQDNYFAGGERTRTVIKIQEGCNNFCSYCLIPYLRGRERSRTLESVRSEVEKQSKLTKEIVFTGINLSGYGNDFDKKISLKDIALMMRDFPDVRFRFSSLEQDIITDDFLKVISETKNFCPHFHLSLQSGCDRTLKYMNRKYTSNAYYKKVELIRKYFSNPAITTDIIVGFPTETDKDFDESYEFAKKCRFARIHVFPFSLRSGTLAERFTNVATNVKEKVLKLMELDKLMFKDYINSFVGLTQNVIVETEEDEGYVGHGENYIKCYIKSKNKLKQNSLVKVKIEKCYKDGAIASVVSY